MPDFYHARARIEDLHREAAARSLAESVPAKPRNVDPQPLFSAADVEARKSPADLAATAALY